MTAVLAACIVAVNASAVGCTDLSPMYRWVGPSPTVSWSVAVIPLKRREVVCVERPLEEPRCYFAPRGARVTLSGPGKTLLLTCSTAPRGRMGTVYFSDTGASLYYFVARPANRLLSFWKAVCEAQEDDSLHCEPSFWDED